jgi:hypothetical protein
MKEKVAQYLPSASWFFYFFQLFLNFIKTPCILSGIWHNYCIKGGGPMDISQEIYDAMLAAIEHYGSKAAFAKAANIQKSMPNEYIKRWEISKCGIIQDDTWERIWPALRQFLPDDPYYLPRSRLNASRSSSGSPPCFIPPELLELVEAWPDLCDIQKTIILSSVKCAFELKKNAPKIPTVKTA